MSYKKVAVNAAKVARDYNISPVKTWQFFVENQFPESKSSQDKGCPKSTFLGLCQVGKVKGIPEGNYTSSKDNSRYGVNALQIIKDNPGKKYEPSELWKEVMMFEEDHNKRANNQMDVVLGLWEEGLLSCKYTFVR